METNNHFGYTGLSSVPAASGLKALPSTTENLYTNGSSINFTPQGKGLNGDMNINGISTVSHTTTSATHSSSHLSHSTVGYEYLWSYSQYPSAAAAGSLKDSSLTSQFPGLGQYPLNGLIAAGRQAGAGGHRAHQKGGQEFWDNGSRSSIGLSFNSQELYNSFHDEGFGVIANDPPAFYTAPQLAPMLASGAQDSSPAPCGKEQGSGQPAEVAARELPSVVPDSRAALVEGLDLEATQPDLKMCSYDETAPALEVAELLPAPDVSCLGDPAPLSEQLDDSHLLSSDNLEPFGADLSRETGSGGLYDMEESELVSEDEKAALGAPADDLSALDCPTFSNSASFHIMADESQNSSLLYAATEASPVLEESVMQDSGFDLNNEREVEQEESEALNTSTPALEEKFQNISLEESVVSSYPEPCLFTGEEVEVRKDGDDGGGGTPGPVTASTSGDIVRRRMATVEEVILPLKHGWKREVRIKKGSHRWQGETWYYGPCGKRMKQFPEVIKYLTRNTNLPVQREHFSFSPRMPVGDFFEERDTPEGLQWVKLNCEEIPSRILAITGKRGRPRNTEKMRAKEHAKVKRGRGRPPKVKDGNLLSRADARTMKKLENQEVLSDEDKLKLSKIKKKMRRKERNKRKQEAKTTKQKETKKKTKVKKEVEKGKPKPCKGKKEKEKVKAVMRKVDKKALAQRRLEERKRQQLILEEMKKPTEDMCLTDHQPLPELSRIPGLLLPSCTFSDCLTIVEFLHSYGKVLGFDVTREVPSLCTLQKGLYNAEDSLDVVQDLLVKLLGAAMKDPGLPPYYQSLKILGERISEIGLNRDSVSEVLRIFLEAYGADLQLCDSLRSKPFQAHPPDTKATILAFLVGELNSSAIIINEIDKSLENMSNYRKNKWIIEGKLRRLKFALAKKMGRPESEVTGLAEGQLRRSSRILEEDDDAEPEKEESWARKFRKDFEGDSPSAANILEMEKQIEKLTKRQTFFRKKLLHASQSLRAVLLGQDRFQRRYWVLPRLGGIFVEGSDPTPVLPEDIATEKAKENLKSLLPDTPPVKAELMEEPINGVRSCSPARPRGRPRKAMPEPEEQDRTKRRRLTQVESAAEPPNGALLANQSQHDLSQSAFLSWLSQTQDCLIYAPVLTPESSPRKPNPTLLPPEELSSPPLDILEQSNANTESTRDMAEKQGQWFRLLPRTPCDPPTVFPSLVATSQEDPPILRAVPQSYDLPCARTPVSVPAARQDSRVSADTSTGGSLPLTTSSTRLHASTRSRKASWKVRGSPERVLTPSPPQGYLVQGQPKRRGRPPTKFFKQIEQKYLIQLTAQPIPQEMQRGWWWIKDPEELEEVLKALHLRGIREKTLHKHLTKHKEYLREVCIRPANDPIFEFSPGPGNPVCWEALRSWSVPDRTFDVDLSILQWVEDLEQRVLMSDLQIRGWMCLDSDSIREDLRYHEHKLDPLEDITIRVKKEGAMVQREATHPLDLAVLRLLALEENMERRYLKEPLWVQSEVVTEKVIVTHPDAPELGQTEVEYLITSRLRTWRQTLERCRSAAQVSLCLYQLERSIAWEKSITKVICLVCRKGDDDEYLLLCDCCDRGCHTYCHRPRITEVPEGDWFCPICVSRQADEDYFHSLTPQRQKKRKSGRIFSFLEGDGPKKALGTRRRENGGMAVVSHYSSEGLSPLKRRRISMRNHNVDLTSCEIILMEMESHEDAWPFLEPVNPRLVPGYRKIIKNPMDLSTMREKLLTGGYFSCEEFAADALLVFDNCQTFNEDDSEVGKAGLSLRKFYESRWAEFYQGTEPADR
ncbi:bromodomain adjacent to zinc finger domain protein 2A isoform X2 [Rhinatrema bivittatum]|uniref:bromodomain adjacent to zinc finger domain protein 2A isoform X2 n=1 Tax=Rhinatrema bivittatum TaxID=194408 RepID=UPI0011276760|nr:bromodomain adjacent to zinc finger domain protein 2A isoform X2 [Rhinatrema bivittatum]